MDSAKELVKIGLTEFSDYIHANSTPPKPRAERTSRPDADLSPEIAEVREQLAAYARELTQDGRTVIRMYAEVMDGARNDEGFKPHHRIAAACELLKCGFDESYISSASVPAHIESEAAEPSLPTTETSALITDDSKLTIDEEREAHEAAWRNKDLSMWETIRKQPRPVITEEHARIGAARFHKTLERWIAWDESDVKIPDSPEGLSQYEP